MNKETDHLNFYSLLSVLQGGMWLQNDIEEFLKPQGLSHGRFSILLMLKESAGTSLLPVEMARFSGKSKPTITKMLKKLEADDLIRTKKEPQDGRTRKTVLTQKGMKLLDRIIPAYNLRLNRMAKGLTVDEKLQLIRLVGKIDFLDPEKRIQEPR